MIVGTGSILGHPPCDSSDIWLLFQTLESVLIRIDTALSGVVLLRGLWQYILNVIRGDS